MTLTMKLGNDFTIVVDLGREMICKRHEDVLVGLSIPLGQNARWHLECAPRSVVVVVVVVEVEEGVVELESGKTE